MRALAVAVALAGVALAAPRGARAQFLNLNPQARQPLPPGEVLVDEVVAAVDLEGDVRTSLFVLGRDVALALRFELATRGAPQPLTTAVDESVSRSVLEQVIGERLIEREAARALDLPPSADEFEAEKLFWQSKLAPVGGAAPLVRVVGLGIDDFDELVRRRLVVSHYLEQHMPRAIEPTELELRTAYDEERVGAFRAEGVPFSVARAEIREALLRQAYPRAVRAYLRSVGGRARVRAWTGAPEAER